MAPDPSAPSLALSRDYLHRDRSEWLPSPAHGCKTQTTLSPSTRDGRHSGALDWVAFDYNTHVRLGILHRLTCYHGVSDIFRIPKFAASVCASQRDPAL